MRAGTLFDRRLLIVAGKGGVGKTTVACCLAREAARTGRRVLLCEIDGGGGAAKLLRAERASVGREAAAGENLSVITVEGKAALAEYLQMIVPVKRLLPPIFKSRMYQYFVAAAPGLKELMTMGKIWYAVQQTGADGSAPRWDTVIVDAPASGHSLQYLRMPAAARDAFLSGLVHRESERLVALLTDPRKTAVNLVTTAEELAVTETEETFRELRKALRMPTGVLFINRLHRAPCSQTDIDAVRRGARRSRRTENRVLLGELASRAEEEASWARLNAQYRLRLARTISMPAVEIPFLPSGEFALPELAVIGSAICAQLSLPPEGPPPA